MVVTDYHKERTMGNVQKEGTMKFPTRWLCCTSKRSCESRSCDRISTYRLRKEKKNVGQMPKNVTPGICEEVDIVRCVGRLGPEPALPLKVYISN